VIDTPSIFKLIRKVVTLTRVRPTLLLSESRAAEVELATIMLNKLNSGSCKKMLFLLKRVFV
jgi:hypothetical protein